MATCAVEVFGLPEEEVRGPRGCGPGFPLCCPSAKLEEAAAARESAVSPLLPLREPRERAWRRGGDPARAGWGGACFREPRFLLKPVDSTPLSSLSRRLLGFLEEVLGRRLGSERRECAEGRASPRHPLPATPRPSVHELWEGGADFPGASHPSGLACSARGQLDLTLWTST